MNSRSLLALSALFFSLACSDESKPPSADGLLADAGRDAPATRYALRVTGGYGGGSYAEGEVVHVFGDVDPRAQLLIRWEGDHALLDYPTEWHATLTMPARDVELTAVVAARTFDPQELTFKGSTTVDKIVRYAIPQEPKGVILFCHGTGGSSDFLLKDESTAFALAALERGFAMIAFEAEESARLRVERAAGTPEDELVKKADVKEDGKIRWISDGEVDNVDFANLDALFASLAQRWPSLAGKPRYAVGMSNGGAFSIALGALAVAAPLAAAFPELRFDAVVSYCASGLPGVARASRTPTAWLMCGQDLHLEVGEEGNREAEASSAAVAANGVATLYDAHPPSPLYEARLARVEGVDVATSTAIVAELRTAGLIDAASMLITPPDDIIAQVVAAPASFPVLNALPVGAPPAVRAQLLSVYADHGFYSDWANRTLDFLAAQSAP